MVEVVEALKHCAVNGKTGLPEVEVEPAELIVDLAVAIARSVPIYPAGFGGKLGAARIVPATKAVYLRGIVFKVAAEHRPFDAVARAGRFFV